MSDTTLLVFGICGAAIVAAHLLWLALSLVCYWWEQHSDDSDVTDANFPL